MANNVIKRTWNQNRMVQIEDLKGMAFQDELAGHTFEISGVNDAGETVELTGTPAGVFLRPDNTDVALTCSVSGGVLSASLPAECYDVPGRFGITVYITDSDSRKTAVYAAVGTVSRTSSGAVSPSTTADVVDLINQISTAVATIPQSWSGLMADIAPTYSTSALYAVGQYVYYGGDLYRCISPITTAESWNSAHWTAAVLGNDVSDLKSAIIEESPNLVSMTNGSVVTHGVTITRDNGKLIIKDSKSDTGNNIHRFSNIFNVPAGTYFFGSRYGDFGNLVLQLRDFTGGLDQGSITQTQGFVKVAIESDTTCAVRILFSDGTNYDVTLYPELISVDRLQDYTPNGLMAVDDLAREQSKYENSGFVSRITEGRIAVIGDSISSCRNSLYCDYSNYIQYYPALGVESVEQTWWKRVANASGSMIAFNESEAGSFVTDQRGTVFPGQDRDDLYERVLSLKARDVNPDLIFVALGTNDSSNSIDLGEYDFETTYTSLSESTFRPAYIKGIKALKAEFPGAKIVCIILKMLNEYASSIRYIADTLGCDTVDCRGYLTGDGTHPNAEGMKQIAYNVLVDDNYFATMRTLPTTDLDNATDVGYYHLASNTTYSHSPLENGSTFTGARMLEVFPNFESSSAYLVQLLWVLSGTYVGNIYTRRRTGGSTSVSWTEWAKISSIKELNELANVSFAYREVGVETSLNGLDEKGYYILSSSYDYDNLPDEIRPSTSGAKVIKVYANNDSTPYVIQELWILSSTYAGNIYIRRRTAGTWSSWLRVYSKQDVDQLINAIAPTINESFVRDTQASQGSNTGLNLRFMSYNICHFNFDSATYISDEKLCNLRKMLMKANADFMAMQEDDDYVDGSSQSSNSYLYYPKYPYRYGGNGVVIHSKTGASSYNVLGYSNGRSLRYCVFNVSESIKLLVISTHPVASYIDGSTTYDIDSPESIAARKTQYEELFKWIKGTIDLNVVGASTPIHVPEYTHCIIGMDSNALTATDKTNLIEYSTDADFIPGNGGVIGWFYTAMRYNPPYAIDNIIVSDNIIINNIESWSDWYDRLYSDHVPVIADLTLLEN